MFPTGREVVLLSLLLVFLLSISNSFRSAPISLAEITKLRNSYYSEEAENVSPISFESQFSLKSLTAPLKWGLGQVPQTQIVAHVPGKYRLPSLFYTQYRILSIQGGLSLTDFMSSTGYCMWSLTVQILCPTAGS